MPGRPPATPRNVPIHSELLALDSRASSFHTANKATFVPNGIDGVPGTPEPPGTRNPSGAAIPRSATAGPNGIDGVAGISLYQVCPACVPLTSRWKLSIVGSNSVG